MKRTALITADRKTLTGITEEGEHVEFHCNVWAWIDVDSGNRFTTRRVIWVDLDAA